MFPTLNVNSFGVLATHLLSISTPRCVTNQKLTLQIIHFICENTINKTT